MKIQAKRVGVVRVGDAKQLVRPHDVLTIANERAKKLLAQHPELFRKVKSPR